MKHIFVISTPFLLKYAIDTVVHLKLENVYFYSTVPGSGKLSANCQLRTPKSRKPWDMIRFWKKSISELKKVSDEGCNFYIANSRPVLSNFIWNHLGGNHSINLLYEGVLFFNPSYKDPLKFDQIIRIVMVHVARIPYQSDSKMFQPYDRRVKSIIIPSKSIFSSLYKNCIEVPFSNNGFSKNKGSILFLTQPQPHLSNKEYQKLLSKALAHLKDNFENREILLKPHYSDNKAAIQFLFKTHPRIKILSANLPAESLVSQHEIEVVVSFYSSSLVNLKLIDKNVTAISFLPTESKDKHIDTIKEVLKRLDVNIVEL